MGRQNNSVKFILYSLGRSGSTAIADELSATESIVCYQEPIVNIDQFSQERKDRLVSAYKQKGIAYSNQQQGTQIHRFGTVREVIPSITPAAYLDLLEGFEGHQDKVAIGVKQVQGQLEPYPEFWVEFRERGYIALCLIRKNIALAALSAAIAAQRGLYNTTKHDHREDLCTVSIDQLDSFIDTFSGARARLETIVKDADMVPHEIYYEDFLENREKFHRHVFDILGVPFEMPRKSEFKKLVPPDLSELVENFTDVKLLLKKRGLSDQLGAR